MDLDYYLWRLYSHPVAINVRCHIHISTGNMYIYNIIVLAMLEEFFLQKVSFSHSTFHQ